MCKVCTEEVHCVALRTRTLWQVWTEDSWIPGSVVQPSKKWIVISRLWRRPYGSWRFPEPLESSKRFFNIMFIHWFYPLLLYIYYQNTQQKTEQRKHGKQGGGEDNNTVCGTMQPKAMRSHTHTHHTSTKYICTSPRHNVIKPKGQNSGKETASQANKCRHNKIHMNMNAFMPPPENPETPPCTKPRAQCIKRT